MSASPWMVQPDIDRLTSIANHFQATEVVEVTNKRMVLWCPTLANAKSLALQIKDGGFHYLIRKGLKTDSWYVQAVY